MRKILGYVITAIGLAGFALTFEQVSKAVKITLPAQVTSTILTVGSLVVLLVGLFLIAKSSSPRSKQAPEVPIYQGKQIVGYRRS